MAYSINPNLVKASHTRTFLVRCYLVPLFEHLGSYPVSCSNHIRNINFIQYVCLISTVHGQPIYRNRDISANIYVVVHATKPVLNSFYPVRLL